MEMKISMGKTKKKNKREKEYGKMGNSKEKEK